MTGPIIPAELWPEHAYAIVWDSDGQSLELRLFGSDWGLVYTHPNIDMPPDNDWRVPVMRPTCKDSLPVAPAIDRERVRASLQSLLNWIDDWAETPGESGIEAIAEEAEAVLALIDWQGQPPITVTDEMVERACAAFTSAGRRERALPSLSPRWMREALESALLPTKGEEE